MGLFGGASKTTTTVAPSANVEALLRQITSGARNMDVGDYIGKQVAGLNPNQVSALSQLSQNPELNRAINMYSGRTDQGIGQLNNINDALLNASKTGVSGRDVLNARNAGLSSSVAKNALAQGNNAGGALASLGGASSGALRRQAAQNTQNNTALINNSRGQALTQQAILDQLNNRQSQLGNLGMQSSIAGTNINAGNQVADLSQQAMNNQLMSGTLQQQQQQNEYNNNWQNTLGQNQFAWNQLNNQLNILNKVSPMAGYTTTSNTPGMSRGQQILGAGMTGVGMIGSMGGFQGFGAKNAQGQYTNQLYNNGGTGAFNGLGNTLSSWGGSLSNMFGGGQ